MRTWWQIIAPPENSNDQPASFYGVRADENWGQIALVKLYPLYKYLVYMPFVAIWTVANFLGVVAVAPFSARLASRWFGGMWGRGLLRAIPGSLQVRAAPAFDPKQSYVIASNHLSLIDIPVLYGWLDLDLKWVMKKEVRNIPVIGIGCALLGHIFIDRANREAAIETLRAFRSNLAPGTSVLFFPEGTRSRDGELHTFKLGAFHMARDLALPILPVTIRGTEAILPPDGIELRPGKAEMIIHPPIGEAQVRSMSAEALRDMTRGIIAAPLVRKP
jgi:1-acyl-sn-glycerol-3-phosphate acyltransferase